MLISQGLKCSRLVCAAHTLLHLWKTSKQTVLNILYLCIKKFLCISFWIFLVRMQYFALLHSWTPQKILFHVSVWLEIPATTQGSAAINVVFFGNTGFVKWSLLSVEPVLLGPEGTGCAQIFCLFCADLKRKLRLTLSVHWSTCRMIYM